MDPINAIAKKHKLAVIEDACQAWLAEYKGHKCGTIGDVGCFSFQESKHIPSGEGGAITSMSEELIDRCNAFHNCGRSVGSFKGKGSFTRGNNYRMMQAQAMLLLQQFEKLQKETAIRDETADYLTANLSKIPGITPVRLPENSRAVWHIYPFRYDSVPFNGLSRDQFMKALTAEGIPCGSIYREQYFDGLLDEAIASRGFKRLWSAQRLKAYRDSFQELKGNKRESIIRSSNKAIVALDASKGVNIRGLTPLTDNALTAVGAAPSAMPGSEVYQALQSGVLDAGLTDLSAAYSRKYYEVQKFGTVGPIFTIYFHMYVNPAWWAKLSPAHQQAIMAAAAKAEQDAIGVTEATAAAALKDLGAKGMTLHVQSPQEQAAWRAAMEKPVVDEFLKTAPEGGAKIIELLQKL